MALFRRLEITGLLPERALLRLKKAGISAYKVKKIQKNRLLLRVNEKDIEKVFAIFPNLCYNNNAYDPYTVRDLGAVGLGKYLQFARERVGFLLGGLLFAVLSLATQPLTLGVEVVGSDAYAREAKAILAQHGVKAFSFYESGEEDLICAKLLSLPAVEFCSVQKIGRRVRVEMRLSDSLPLQTRKGDMTADYAGKLLSLTALKGTPLKSVGDEVRAGEPLVGGYFSTADGARTETTVVAQAKFACVYEATVAAASEEEAKAAAYLAASEKGEVRTTAIAVEQVGENAFCVRLEYTATQAMNM